MSTRDLFQRGGNSPGGGGSGSGGPDEFKRQLTGPLGQRVTRPLAISPVVLEQEMTRSREMLQLCQAIVQRFEARMAILGAVLDRVAPRQVQPITVLNRLDTTSRRFAEKLQGRIERREEVLRRAVIAYTQYFEASRALKDVQGRFTSLSSLGLQEAWDTLMALEIPKLQGRLYPLTNLCETFKDEPLLVELFPPIR
jgi:hypothetical protein